MSEPSSREGDGAAAPDVLASRLQVTSPWADRLVQGLVLAVVALGTTFLGAPGVSSQKIPELKDDDVGKVFRAPSPAGLKASRDYDLLDEARTQAQKEDARAKVRPVFDYDPQVQQQVMKDLQAGFTDMQDIVNAWETEHSAKKADDASGAKGAKKEPAAPGEAKKAPPPPKYDEELLAMLKDARKGFEAHVLPLDDDDFDTLANAHFSREVEKATLGLLEVAYRAKLVISRDELSRIDSGGITVRMVGGTDRDARHRHPASGRDGHDGGAERARPLRLRAGQPAARRAAALKRRAVLRLAKRQLRPNLTVNIAETEARRHAAYADAVKPAVITIKKGQKVIGDGELITETHLVDGARHARPDATSSTCCSCRWAARADRGCWCWRLWVFYRAAFRRFRPTRKDAVFMGALLLVLLGAAAPVGVDRRRGARPATLGAHRGALLRLPARGGGDAGALRALRGVALFFALVFSAWRGGDAGRQLAFVLLFTLLTSLVAADAHRQGEGPRRHLPRRHL